MIIIGELINCSRKSVLNAVENSDASFIADLATAQAKAGADYIGINAGIPESEPETMAWLVEVVQRSVNLPLCFDSESAQAQQRGLESYDWKRGKPILNSISLESSRLALMLEAIEKWKPQVIGLCAAKGMIKGRVESKIEVARSLVGYIRNTGLKDEDIFLDPCVLPVAIDQSNGTAVADSVATLHVEFPNTHIVCGVSNVSFGLPGRKWLNRAYVVMLMTRGLDVVVCDPTDQILMSLIRSAETLRGNDQDCEIFLKYFRSGAFPTL
jgi:5-methyltetrahydrofolate--homocysteine methyltransferase